MKVISVYFQNKSTGRVGGRWCLQCLMLRRDSRCDTAASLPQGHAHRAFIRAAAHARAVIVRLNIARFPFFLYPLILGRPSPLLLLLSTPRDIISATIFFSRLREDILHISKRRFFRSSPAGWTVSLGSPGGGHLSSGIFQQPPDPVICECAGSARGSDVIHSRRRTHAGTPPPSPRAVPIRAGYVTTR